MVEKTGPVGDHGESLKTALVLGEIATARQRQQAQDENLACVPEEKSQGGACRRLGLPLPVDALSYRMAAFTVGKGSHAAIAVHQLCEAVGARNSEVRRAALVMLAATITGWIEAIDQRRKDT